VTSDRVRDSFLQYGADVAAQAKICALSMVEQNCRIFPFFFFTLRGRLNGIEKKLFFGKIDVFLILRFAAYLFFGYSIPYIATWQ
jgi:hypothetical protein